jgi:UDP-glucose 6-dehydrogenase
MPGLERALFGFAFKANISKTRESSAIYIARGRLEEKAQALITNPKALHNTPLCRRIRQKSGFCLNPVQSYALEITIERVGENLRIHREAGVRIRPIQSAETGAKHFQG